MQIIDGKKVAAEIKAEIALEVDCIKSSGGKIPHLAAILVGHDPPSETYVAGKVRACEEIGFKSTLVRFDNDISEETLINAVHNLNKDADIDGFIVQLPLPGHISEQNVIESIDPAKDVDGFHPVNIGRMVLGMPSFISATPAGIIELIRRYEIPTAGKACLVIGRSNIVGRPLSNLLSLKGYPGNATVTLAHSKTSNIPELALKSDIIIAALGSPGFITGEMVKEGAVIIDVGITRVKSDLTRSGYKLTGDVKFDEVAPKCSYITPVPGGVGPMTIVSLLRNTLLASKQRISG
ncbi:MAG: bifunctional 5,10-methylene-tetrahydrofolate dehydrogenase/5,10-methylene-tetrahydrofolate cyclohydrolase [Bacteroidales bacterium]|nr:bifunctional 5,10-methylene-tetrahydrofolate dehydrogenase/5,10-methylene-tetrahydrofolate cyclohydrolase [Bacteroidales bacterium]